MVQTILAQTALAITAENHLEFLKDTVIFINPEILEGARLAAQDIIATRSEEQATLGNNIPNPFLFFTN